MFEPVDWVHAITTQITDKGRHVVRYCGAYANRARTLYRSEAAEPESQACPRCGSELRIVSVITDPVVVDRILSHRRHAGLRSPFEPRAPPAA